MVHDFDDFLAKNPGAKIYMATTKAARSYTDVQYEDDCYIMFGKESAGIPESILQKYQENAFRYPPGPQREDHQGLAVKA